MSAPLLSTIPLIHLSPPNNSIHVALFTDVANGAFLRRQLIDGNEDFEYAFIDCANIVGTSQVLSACFRAINDAQNDRLRSRNVHSEIVFSLGTNSNIGTSLKAFGVDATTKHLLAIKVSRAGSNEMLDAERDAIQHHLNTHVQGHALPFTKDSISKMTDWPKVRKTYKLSDFNLQSLTNGSDGAESELHKEIETAIVGMIVLRGS
ncbi:MAG: hypothetical protein Q9162_001648 [Coniocarpon cinnabarinum]